MCFDKWTHARRRPKKRLFKNARTPFSAQTKIHLKEVYFLKKKSETWGVGTYSSFQSLSSDSSSLFYPIANMQKCACVRWFGTKKIFRRATQQFSLLFWQRGRKKKENDFYDRSVSSAVIIFLLPRPCNYRRLTLGYTKRGKNDKKEEKEVKKILCSDFFTIVPNRDWIFESVSYLFTT